MAQTDPDDPIVSMSIRLPRSQVDALQAIADERVVGRHLIVRRAIDEYLSNMMPVDIDTEPPRMREEWTGDDET